MGGRGGHRSRWEEREQEHKIATVSVLRECPFTVCEDRLLEYWEVDRWQGERGHTCQVVGRARTQGQVGGRGGT